MLAPGDKRPTWLEGVIQIHVTRACDLSCTGCTQGSNLAGKPVMMNLEQFEQAIITLKDYYGVVGIFGGNPTLHPDFEQICAIAKQHIPKFRLGLWSNNLRGYGKLCRDVFSAEHSNLNVHCNVEAYNEIVRDWPEARPKGLTDSRHSPPYISPIDLGYNYWDLYPLIEKCDINQYWSAMICIVDNQLRGYFCEIAGAQAMLHDDYPDLGLPVKPGWWQRPMADFKLQVDFHCYRCGIPLRHIGDLAVNGKKEFVTKEHLSIYKLKRPNSRELVILDTKNFKQVKKATDYIENGLINA